MTDNKEDSAKATTSKKKKSNQLWKPGQSGNPAGRPKGSKNKTTAMREAIEAKLVGKLNKDAEDIYKKCVHLAMSGDTTCIKILMERLVPVVKPSNDDTGASNKGVVINISGMEVGTGKATIEGNGEQEEEIEDAEIIEDSPK